MATKDVHEDKEFTCFRDETGNLCHKDKLMQGVGHRHYCLSESVTVGKSLRNIIKSRQSELRRAIKEEAHGFLSEDRNSQLTLGKTDLTL